MNKLTTDTAPNCQGCGVYKTAMKLADIQENSRQLLLDQIEHLRNENLALKNQLKAMSSVKAIPGAKVKTEGKIIKLYFQ